MNQTTILICCLVFLTLSGIQGIPLSRTVRCTCISISNQPVFRKLEIIPPSQFCPHCYNEKKGEKRCLNPESKAIKNLLKAVSKERSKRSP
uniref:Chemokine interleukin-8-like domain-containing protein n=1 Tax=Rhinopithecus bieti TaxID=61621 RepID=A0A2K6LP98_RHIBE